MVAGGFKHPSSQSPGWQLSTLTTRLPLHNSAQQLLMHQATYWCWPYQDVPTLNGCHLSQYSLILSDTLETLETLSGWWKMAMAPFIQARLNWFIGQLNHYFTDTEILNLLIKYWLVKINIHSKHVVIGIFHLLVFNK